MSATKCFVLVFGDPAQNGDTLESETYEAGDAYPKFEVRPGDFLLLYCTDGYPNRPRQIAGLGVAVTAEPRRITYRRIPLKDPILREQINGIFDPEDWKKMTQLGLTSRRAFEIKRESFERATSGQSITWP
ncbi:MAG TPA: hypothetical protein VME68_12550 [Acidobacteriaceae bacterium]|nr:hypothetical protein [Acidobacteriaceae bacterium]